MTRTIWSKAERDFLRTTPPSYEGFIQRFGEGRTRNAWHMQRHKMGLVGVDPPAGHTADTVRMAIVEMHAQADRQTDPATLTVQRMPESEEYEALFDHLEAAEEERGGLKLSQKVATFTSPDRLPIALACMSDVHAGAGGVAYGHFRRDLETIAATDGLYVIVNGDLMETGLTFSKAGQTLYSGAFNAPRDQYTYMVSRLSRVKDKLIAIGSGNHDARHGQVGIDRLPEMARDLGTVYYSEGGLTLTLRIGDERYVVALSHQFTGSSKITPSNRHRRMSQEWVGTREPLDAVVVSHLHEPLIEVVMQRGTPIVYVSSGSYKYLSDGYSESKNYKPAYGVPILVLSPDRHSITPFIDFDEGVRYLEQERHRYQHQEIDTNVERNDTRAGTRLIRRDKQESRK